MKLIYREIFVYNALQRISFVNDGDICAQIKLGLTTRDIVFGIMRLSLFSNSCLTLLITSKRLPLFTFENRDEETSFQDGVCRVHSFHNGLQVPAILARYSAGKYFTL